MDLATLSTPSLLIERHRLDDNLQRMQDKADANGVVLRPHMKTHKSVDLARKQLDYGAEGITVAKVGEAEIYAKAGFDDIRIAYIVIGEEKYARIASLMESARVSFCVDTLEGARRASAYFDERDLMAEVLIEVDCGYGRCGVGWDREAGVAFAREVAQMPGLHISGILTHAGDSYDGPSSPDETKEEALRSASNRERDRMIAFAARLDEEGLPAARDKKNFEISIGSTPSMKYFENRGVEGFRVTEIRPGNYVFNDGIQVGLGVASWTQCIVIPTAVKESFWMRARRFSHRIPRRR